MPAALECCVRRALSNAGVEPAEIELVAPGAAGDGVRAPIEEEALAAVLSNREVETIRVKHALGECDAASGSLQLGAVLAWHRADPERDGRVSLITASTAEGGVAAAAIRGWSRDDAGRR